MKMTKLGWKHTFEKSASISTYLYAMDAGPFKIIPNDKKFHVPIQLSVRQSKLSYLNSDEYFRILEAAILFYEDFFSTPFPFEKYEIVFCPEFRVGGMENVGLINMTDRYFKSEYELTGFNRYMY
jgi:aminopeptidase N